MEKKELERLERIEEKLDILFDLIKGKLTTGIYTSGNTGRTTLEHITNPVIRVGGKEELDIENWEREWEITPVYNQISFIKVLLDKAREEGRRELVKEIREAIRENMNKNWDIEKRHIAIDEDIVRIINDGEITEMYTEGEEELKDGGWGWYS